MGDLECNRIDCMVAEPPAKVTGLRRRICSDRYTTFAGTGTG